MKNPISWFFGMRKAARGLYKRMDAPKSLSVHLSASRFTCREVQLMKEAWKRKVEVSKGKYSAEWNRYRIVMAWPDCSSILQAANQSMYDGGPVQYVRENVCGENRAIQALYERRTRLLYGDDYDILIHHDKPDDRVNEILITDAMKTGRWKELPYELQSIYCERIGISMGEALDDTLEKDYELYKKMTEGTNAILLMINAYMYFGGKPDWVLGISELYDSRTRELYGDKYDELIDHEGRDERVVEILIADAVKTGKWFCLPRELRYEYEDRMGSSIE